jgi:hypothetical protein
MKPLFIKGHINGRPVGRMMVAGGASNNIMLTLMFEKLGHREEELKQTNLSLSGVLGEPAEARGMLSAELIVGSKTLLTVFFVVEVRGRYNILLRGDWIHANECVLSTLHQCVIQWVGDQAEVVDVDEGACIAMTESQVDVQGGLMRCRTGRHLSEYDYVSTGRDGFVPISVKPMRSTTRLNNSA